jgi:hypothetical protein
MKCGTTYRKSPSKQYYTYYTQARRDAPSIGSSWFSVNPVKLPIHQKALAAGSSLGIPLGELTVRPQIRKFYTGALAQLTFPDLAGEARGAPPYPMLADGLPYLPLSTLGTLQRLI